jgi:hypothetical protein
MVALTSLLLGAFIFAFAYCLFTATTRRQMICVTLAAVLVIGLAAPPQAKAQGILVGIQAILNTLNGPIKTFLTAINSIRSAVNNLYQLRVWPLAAIKAATGQVTQMIGQYRNLLQNLYRLPNKNATLPIPVTFENLLKNHQVNDYATLTTTYSSVFGALPSATAASPEDRRITDMDDALLLDTMKTAKAADAGADLTLQLANTFEDGASQAVPGSAPFLTAGAQVANIQTQIRIQALLTAALREDAARMAHDNSIRKRSAQITTNLNERILQLLSR